MNYAPLLSISEFPNWVIIYRFVCGEKFLVVLVKSGSESGAGRMNE
jgi:hypothetical protein